MTTATAHSDHIGHSFAALSDPTRRAMLARLGKVSATVSKLAQPFLGRHG